MREKRNRGVFGVGVSLFTALVLIGLTVGTAPAQEGAALPTLGEKIIRLATTADRRIQPGMAKVKKGTTVIWINRGSAEARISFSGDQKIQQVCAAPVNFSQEADGSYSTGHLPFAGTASLCFLEAGTYTYVVRANWLIGVSEPNVKSEKGTIIVE
jgi:plastocyanin